MRDIHSFPDPRHALAVRVAVQAGRKIIETSRRESVIKDEASRELVTEADREAEALITEAIRQAFPQDAILGEEYGLAPGTSGHTWVIDPIDGTTNYTNRIPVFCVSVAVFSGALPVIGVAYDPTRDDLFHAVRGQGAYHGSERIAAKTEPLSVRALFGYSSRFIGAAPPHVLGMLESFDEYRNFGAAVLHLCYTACGWLDGAFSDSTRLWDVAAGGLILEEAGGRVMDFSFNPLFPLSQGMTSYERSCIPFLGTGDCPDLSLLKNLFHG